MKSYMIAYDLNRAKNYPDLIEAIKENFGTFWHHLDSAWIVKTDLSASQICDILSPHIDSDDELLVVGLQREAAWVGFNEKGSQWLQSHL